MPPKRAGSAWTRYWRPSCVEKFGIDRNGHRNRAATEPENLQHEEGTKGPCLSLAVLEFSDPGVLLGRMPF